MSLIVAGTYRVENLDGLRPHMAVVVRASRQEDGCLEYAHAEDALEPGLIRVFEVWRDRAALDAHFAAAHMTPWRSVWSQFGVSERRLIAYEVASHKSI